ncbi:MAG: amino acid adenylation domain-containing protein [Methylacidiphilales bacterium]|nr:amino acid adenylation domain-containing protein [Candidatus Methylacidiphilales bacterium]
MSPPPSLSLQNSDRVRYLANGDLEYLGRLDNQVKIRGFRIELGEIESVLQTHPLVSQAVVVVCEGERLLGYVVLTSACADISLELRSFLTEKLPGYMIPGIFVVLEELPLTPNGKINRKALPAADNSRLGLRIIPKSHTEELLAAIWVSVLGVDIVDVGDNFFDLGGHSLLATRVVAQIRQVFGVDLPLRRLFEAPKFADLALIIEQMVQTRSQITIQPILPVERGENLPLSFAQERFWILAQIEPESPSYNIPLVIKIEGNIDVEILQRSFREVVQQQEILRTRFIAVDGKPRLEIVDDWELEIPVINLVPIPTDLQQQEVATIIQTQAKQAFDLGTSPAIRVNFLYLGDRNYAVLLTLHHIIADAWSMGLLVQEITKSYHQLKQKTFPHSQTPPLPIQYVDFAVWQRNWLQGEVLARHLDYWLESLVDAPALLELPTDFPRPAVQSFRGAVYKFQLAEELTRQVKQLSQRHHSTLFMTLLAAWNVLLYRYTGSDRIVVGSPIANRQHGITEGLIGCFANTLAFCTNLSKNPSFEDLLQRVRENALSAYAHQDLPFEQLVEAIQPVRSLSYSPIFQVMLILQNIPVTKLEMEGIKWQVMESDRGTSKYDLTLVVAETDAGLSCKLEYSTDLFKGATIERLAENFQTLLESIVKNPQGKISELSILSVNEQQLLTEWNQTQREYPHTEYLHQLFEFQVEKSPVSVAAIWGNESISYQELNVRANQLAHFLQSLGVKPEVTVGICTERSLDMLIGLLAILKAGGVYVPLDGNYPKERLELIIQDAKIQVLILQQQQLAKLPDLNIPVINLDVDGGIIARKNIANPHTNLTENNLAYLIYTSGTTGIPKGVAISHRSPITLMHWAKEVYSQEQLKGVLASTSICFDLSVFEIFVPLSWGGTIILADNALQLPELPAKSQVTLINTVPSAARELMRLEGIPTSVQTVNLAGEPLPQSLVEQLYQQPTIEQVINLYGPSEDTTYSTIVIIPKHSQEPPTIGHAIANTQVYILDENLHPVPIGVPGEIYLDGSGVARGYWGKPDLTAEKFLPNPNCMGRETRCRDAIHRFYKTGDRARFLADGNIEYLGRWDYQVKLRGFRIELGEIETIISQHPQVSQVVAVVREDSQQRERLVAYVVGKSNLQAQELREFITTKLPSYMLPSIFVFLEALPLTTNGKIDRNNLPIPELVPISDTFIPPHTILEQQLTQIWSQILGVESVGIHDNFFSLGGDSILAIQLVAKVNQQGLALFPRQIFQYQTVAELASIIKNNGEITISQEVVTGEIPLTPIQHWFFEENLIEPHHWNQAVFLEVTQPLNFEWLQQAWQELITHHEMLRSRFVQTADGWKQEIGEGNENVTYVDLSGVTNKEITSNAIASIANQLQASFDLSQPPLLRVAYFKLGNGQNHRLLIILHHLIVDGVSWRIILEDLRTTLVAQTTLYQQLSQKQATKLPPKTTSFQQWGMQLKEYTLSQDWQSTLDYWTSLPWQQVQPLPVDFPDGSNTMADINIYSVSLNSEDTQALLQQVPRIYNTQINDILLTALMLAFRDWTGNETFSLELEGHGREDLFPNVNLSRTVGWFTSLFPVCLDVDASNQLDIVLKTIKEQLRKIPERGINYGLLRYLASPEIQTQLQNIPSPEVRFNYLGQSDQMFSSDASLFIPAKEFAGYSRSLQGTRSNLIEINSIVTGGQLRLDWLYSRAIHQPQTINKLANNYLTKLLEIIHHCLSSNITGFTPSDFPQMEFTQDELDDLLADL